MTGIKEFLDCDVWGIGIDTGEPGIRCNKSFDEPGYFILQIQSPTHGTLSARFGPEVLAEIHRQAMS